MALLVAARDLPQDAIPATKVRFGRPPNTLMIYCSENYIIRYKIFISSILAHR